MIHRKLIRGLVRELDCVGPGLSCSLPEDAETRWDGDTVVGEEIAILSTIQDELESLQNNVREVVEDIDRLADTVGGMEIGQRVREVEECPGCGLLTVRIKII